jgi:hypothetical protein
LRLPPKRPMAVLTPLTSTTGSPSPITLRS